MNVYFRVDASTLIGSGHVMRCLTLAEKLQRQGATICFISREQKGHLCDYIEKSGYEVLRLPSIQNNNGNLRNNPYSQWLGEKLSVDAYQTKELLKDRKIDLLVVDHYAISEEWEKDLREISNKIMVIDDLANRKHDCDFLLDQNFYEDHSERYKNLVPEDCKLFLGPSYVLLRNEFYCEVHKSKVRTKVVKRILIFFGGSDPSNETGKVLASILDLNRYDIQVDVVIGQSNLYKTDLESICENYEFLNFYCQVNNMAELINRADLCIGAGGTTTWERCFLGLPSIVISIAENQEEICKTLGEKKIIKYLGKKEEVKKESLTLHLKEVISSEDKRCQMSKLSFDLFKENINLQNMMIKELLG